MSNTSHNCDPNRDRLFYLVYPARPSLRSRLPALFGALAVVALLSSSAAAMEGNQGYSAGSKTSNPPSATDGPGGHQQNWVSSLKGWAKSLFNNPYGMDAYGRMPGERGYKGAPPKDYFTSNGGSAKNSKANKPGGYAYSKEQ